MRSKPSASEKNAALPTEHDARLLEWTIVLPDAASLDAVAASLVAAGHAIEREERAAPDVVTRDPWGTQLRLRVEVTR
jgi:hypothetical protein